MSAVTPLPRSRFAEAVRRVVDQAPPLTSRQADRLTVLLNGSPDADAWSADTERKAA